MRTYGLPRAVPAPPHNVSQESVPSRAGRLPGRQLRSRGGRLWRKAVAHTEEGGNGGPAAHASPRAGGPLGASVAPRIFTL